MKKLKKTMVLLITLAMVMSIASCDSIGNSKKSSKNKADDDYEEDVIALAEDFSGALQSLKADKVLKLCDEDYADDEGDNLKEMLDFDSYDELKADILEKIADTITYEVDKKSVEVDDDEATIDVTFTMVDYTTVFSSNETYFLDSLKDSINSADTMDLTYTLECEMNDDDEWIVTNVDEVVDGVFEFVEVDATIVDSFELGDYVTGCVYSDAGEDITEISLTLSFDNAIDSFDKWTYYEVTLDGELIYDSDYDDATLPMTMTTSDVPAFTNDDGYLVAGTYVLSVFDENFTEIYSYTWNITNSAPAVVLPDAILPDGFSRDKFNLPADASLYMAKIDETAAYAEDIGVDVDDLTGNIYIYMYLVISADKAYVVLDGDAYSDSIAAFISENLETIVYSITGVTVQQYADISDLTYEEAFDELYEMLAPKEGEYQSIVVDNPYTIDGTTIDINGKIECTMVSNELITLDASEAEGISAFVPDGIIYFQYVAE